jgi:putative ABC transport system permease protein
MRVQNQTVAAGRSFTAAEESAGRAVCIVGATVQKKVFQSQHDVGQYIRVGTLSCPVIGVLEERGLGGGTDQDDVVLIPLRAAQRQIAGNQSIASILIAVDPAYESSSVGQDVERLLKERRHIGPGQDGDVRIIDVKQIADTVSGAMAALTALVSVIASISLLVGGIGIANIMLVSVTERTREIGIRMAIGALAREVRLQFLTEAVVLCSMGGAIGVALAFILSVFITSLMKVDFAMAPSVVLGSLVFASLLGIVFGYVPARRAAALNPIEALHHE